MGKQFDRKRSRGSRTHQGAAEIIEFKGPKFQHDRNPPPIKPLNAARRPNISPPCGKPANRGPRPRRRRQDLDRRHLSPPICSARAYRENHPHPPQRRPAAARSASSPARCEDKFAPWAVPIADAIKERIGAAAFEIALQARRHRNGPVRGDARALLEERLRAARRGAEHHASPRSRPSSPASARIASPSSTATSASPTSSETSGLRRMIELIAAHGLPVPVIAFSRGRHRALRPLRHVGARLRGRCCAASGRRIAQLNFDAGASAPASKTFLPGARWVLHPGVVSCRCKSTKSRRTSPRIRAKA